MKSIALGIALTIALGCTLSAAQETASTDKKPEKTTTPVKSAEQTSGAAKINPHPAAKAFPTRRPADKSELNPQPLPPKENISRTTTAGNKVELNPQPLPPGAKTTAGSKVELNPQPLPPGKVKATTTPDSKVELNPQPLPPRVRNAGTKKKVASTGAATKNQDATKTQK